MSLYAGVLGVKKDEEVLKLQGVLLPSYGDACGSGQSIMSSQEPRSLPHSFPPRQIFWALRFPITCHFEIRRTGAHAPLSRCTLQVHTPWLCRAPFVTG